MRVAVYHNLMSGGAKRALFETVRRLVDYHSIDMFTLSSAEHDFCDLRAFVGRHFVFKFDTLPLVPSPFGFLNHGVRTIDILRLHSVQRLIAHEIDVGGYDVAFVYASDQFTNGPLLLQYLQTPSVCYCNDSLRTLYDPPIIRPYLQLSGIRRIVDRVNVLRRAYQTYLKNEDRRSLRSAESLLVNSYFSRETIYRIYGIQPRVCYLGIDTQVFRRESETRDNYVLSVGTVNPIKGHDFIIHSLSLIPESIRPLLVIVGNFAVPDEVEYLSELARARNIRVEFRVMVSISELVQLYSKAKVTLYAPFLEPFGLVALESMACGTPVIGVAEGGVRETIRHNETGLLTDRDEEQFAAAVVRLLTKPELVEALGQCGAQYVRESWRWDETVRQLESFLHRAVD